MGRSEEEWENRKMAVPASCDVTGRIHHGLELQLLSTLGRPFGGGVGDVE